MGRIRQIGITLSLIGLLIFSWISVLTIESSEDKQKRLYDQAQSLMSDEIYVRAQPLLEEAVGISASLTKDSEEALKTVYLELIHLSGYESKYIALLEKQLSKETATPVEFFELAEYYFSSGKQAEAISVLREGADKTSDISLTERYEAERYAFVYGRVLFEEVTTFLGNTIQVQNGGLWGICSYAGKQIIPCTYEKISTYYNGVAIVQQEGEIYAVDGNSSKLYITAEPVYNFGNLSENRIAFFGESGLLRGNSQLTIASSELGFIGTYWNGYASAEQNGLWGIVDVDANWIVPSQYDGIISDELGRSVGQGRFFAVKNESVLLLDGDGTVLNSFDDAKPFADGYAAVKKEDKWGFVDKTGQICIDFQFDNALSFGQHLAPVEVDGKWGYISTIGDIVIEPIYLEAKNFSNSVAPVKTEDGWKFINLIEK